MSGGNSNIVAGYSSGSGVGINAFFTEVGISCYNASGSHIVENGNLKYDIAMDSSYDGASYDLESPLDSSSWILRFKWDIDALSSGSSNGSQGYIGMSDKEHWTSSSHSADIAGISFVQQHNSVGDMVINASDDNNDPMNFGGSGSSGRQMSVSLQSGTSYYVEIKRDGNDFTTSVSSSNSYSGDLGTNTQTETSTADLQYIWVQAQKDSSGSTLETDIDEIQICDGEVDWANCSTVGDGEIGTVLSFETQQASTSSTTTYLDDDFASDPSWDTDSSGHWSSTYEDMEFKFERSNTLIRGSTDLGQDLSGVDFTIRFDIDPNSFSQGGDNFGWFGLTDSPTIGRASQDFFGMMIRGDGSNGRYCANEGSSNTLEGNWCAGSSVDIGSQWTVGTHYYFEILKVGNTIEVKRYTDDTYGTVADTTGAQTGTTSTGLQHFKYTNWDSGSTNGWMHGHMDNLNIFADITTTYPVKTTAFEVEPTAMRIVDIEPANAGTPNSIRLSEDFAVDDWSFSEEVENGSMQYSSTPLTISGGNANIDSTVNMSSGNSNNFASTKELDGDINGEWSIRWTQSGMQGQSGNDPRSIRIGILPEVLDATNGSPWDDGTDYAFAMFTTHDNYIAVYAGQTPVSAWCSGMSTSNTYKTFYGELVYDGSSVTFNSYDSASNRDSGSSSTLTCSQSITFPDGQFDAGYWGFAHGSNGGASTNLAVDIDEM